MASAELAQWVATNALSDVPAAVRHEAKRSLVNYFAVALAAANDTTVSNAIKVLMPFSNGNTCTLVGRQQRGDMLTAAAEIGRAHV